MILNLRQVDPNDVQYFGLSPSLVGVFQLNVKISPPTPPGNSILLGFFFKEIPSTTGPTAGKPLQTTIAVK